MEFGGEIFNILILLKNTIDQKLFLGSLFHEQSRQILDEVWISFLKTSQKKEFMQYIIQYKNRLYFKKR